MAAEMGLQFPYIYECTLAEFNIMYAGYRIRQEQQWDIARRGWAYTMVYGGMGLRKDAKIPSHQELYPLEYTDRIHKAPEVSKKISSLGEAYKLLKEFE